MVYSGAIKQGPGNAAFTLTAQRLRCSGRVWWILGLLNHLHLNYILLRRYRVMQKRCALQRTPELVTSREALRRLTWAPRAPKPGSK